MNFRFWLISHRNSDFVNSLIAQLAILSFVLFHIFTFFINSTEVTKGSKVKDEKIANHNENHFNKQVYGYHAYFSEGIYKGAYCKQPQQ